MRIADLDELSWAFSHFLPFIQLPIDNNHYFIKNIQMKKTPQILIVDDGEQNRDFIRNLLISLLPHARITEATNGREALDQATQHIHDTNQCFDLIVMDYQMPVMNGAQASAYIRQQEQQAKVNSPSIIITWSSADIGPFPSADDSLPKYTDKASLKAMLACYGLIA